MSAVKSIPAIWRDAIRDDASLDLHSKSIAFCLSTYMDRFGYARPGRKAIASGAGVGVKTVDRRLRLLELGGYVRIERGRGRDVTSEYWATLPPKGVSGSRLFEWEKASERLRKGVPPKDKRRL